MKEEEKTNRNDA